MLNKNNVIKRKIIKDLYFNDSLSCADLSKSNGKSVPLITKLLNELIEEGKVLETGLAASTGGRRPQMYSIKQELMYVVAVAMDQLVTRIVLLDMRNNYVSQVKNVDLTLTDNPNSLKELTSHIETFISQCGVPENKIAGIGIGMPGLVDVNKGINLLFLKPEKGSSVVSHIQSKTSIPVVIDNDSGLIALAELKLGIARGKKNVMVLNIGWGIGLGVIIQGELFKGANGFAGEFSHIPLFDNGKKCSCGKTGCLQTETSLLVVAEKAIKGLNEGRQSKLAGISIDHVEAATKAIMEAALLGDKFAIELLSESGYNIGRGIAVLIHVLNPEMIVLSGRGSVAGSIWITPVQQAIADHSLSAIAENTKVKISSLRYDAELIGAAALVMDKYDQLPVL